MTSEPGTPSVDEIIQQELSPLDFMSAVSAFDTGLKYGLAEDINTLALWVSIGLEVATFAAITRRDPARAFVRDQVPSFAEIRDFTFMTKRYIDLADTAEELYPNASYPADSRVFMNEIRNKLMHLGNTARVGFAGVALRLVWDTAGWLSGLELPDEKLRHPPEILQAERLSEVPEALRKAARDVAAEQTKLLAWGLNAGYFDDRPDLKVIAEQELADCSAILDRWAESR